MWRHYLTMMLRRLGRDRTYSAITIGGLALGLAGSLLMLGYVRYERSYDGWLPDAGRLYQVQTTWHPPGQPDVLTQMSSFALHDALPVRFPGVEAVASLTPGKTVTEHDGRPMFIDSTTVSPDFFQVLALPFLHGSAATALPDTNTIVLARSEAVRQFGTDDVLGRTLSLGAGAGKRDYRVGGVLRDLPRNSSLKLGIVYRQDLAQIPPERRGWFNTDQQNYVKLRPRADPAAINAAIPAWKKREMPHSIVNGRIVSIADAMDVKLVPLGDVHLGPAQEGALRAGGDPRALATFAIVAMLTLCMAVMNFVNLTTARAVQRAREVALRKVLGATRRQLVVQLMGESLLICAAAMLIALALVEVATPWFGDLLGADLDVPYLGPHGMLLPALGLTAFTGLAGGLYPAFYLSRFRPARVLRTGRGFAETRGNGRLRAALVVVQFAIAIGLIASTAIIWSQTRFVERVDPGYRRDGLIQIANGWRFTQGAEYEAARRALLAVPGVMGVARTDIGIGSPEKSVRLMRLPGSGEYMTTGFHNVDADLLSTMDINLLAGRSLGDRFAADRLSGASTDDLIARGINVVINRATAVKLGYRSPRAALGHVFQIGFDGGRMVPSTVAGVVEDTRFRAARDAVQPTVYAYDPEHTDQVLVRYADARPGEVMAALGEVWRRFEPEIPFDARFADDIVREFYAAERARTILFAGFSLLAVLIACLGLYSLAAFTAERRTKEIGIRKVFGARVRDIVRLLAWQFSKPVVVANLVAWPAAWWAMRDWLNTFDARIALGPGPFLLAALLALGIAVFTVAGHAFRVARLNPIHALRYE